MIKHGSRIYCFHNFLRCSVVKRKDVATQYSSPSIDSVDCIYRQQWLRRRKSRTAGRRKKRNETRRKKKSNNAAWKDPSLLPSSRTRFRRWAAFRSGVSVVPRLTANKHRCIGAGLQLCGIGNPCSQFHALREEPSASRGRYRTIPRISLVWFLVLLCTTWLFCVDHLPLFACSPLSQQIQSNFIVVIHPGSRTLRIGRATDNLPVGLPHVIARRHKQTGQPRYEDAWLLRDGLNVSWPDSPWLSFCCSLEFSFAD